MELLFTRFTSALKPSITIQRLILRNISLTRKGLASLVLYLKTIPDAFPSLIELDISENVQITLQGLDDLAEGLYQNSSLEVLRISKIEPLNQVTYCNGDFDRMLFGKYLRHNKVIP
jgi:hypothetical protein